jgi:hypothetical protein
MTVGLLSGLDAAFNDRNGPELYRLQRALEYCLPFAAKWTKDRKVYIPAIDEDASAASARFRQIYQRLGDDKEERFVGYDIADVPLADWIKLYRCSATTAEVIRHRLSINDWLGAPVPENARLLRSLILSDEVKAPRRRKGKPSQLHRDTLLSALSKKVQERFGFDLGAAKATYLQAERPPVRACTIAADALSAFGVSVGTPMRADEIARNRSLPTEKIDFLLMPPGQRAIVDAFLGRPVRKVDEHEAAAVAEYSAALRYFNGT